MKDPAPALPDTAGLAPALLPGVVDRLGALAFRMKLSRSKLSHNASDRALIEKVKHRLLEGAAQTEFADTARQFDWQVAVVQSPQVNAVALPGGKIIVYTGLLQRRPDLPPVEQRLAVALGHEMVHALARHAAQRIDKELQTALELAVTGKELSDAKLDPAATAGLMTAMGITYEGAVMRPFTAEQESEADHVGLLITAQAGFEPRAAVTFWEQMSKLSHGKKPIELLTMHPSYDVRIAQLKGWMDDAETQYQRARLASAQNNG